MALIRLDKYLAQMNTGSRNEVKAIVKRGNVSVNGIVIKSPEYKVDTDKDIVNVYGNNIVYKEFEYYMLNKPRGVLSATEDKKEKTVIDLISKNRRKDLFPAGRLDKDTEGLLLITNDGELAHKLLAPKNHIDKVYYAEVTNKVTKEDIAKFAEGIKIGDEFTAMPAKLEIKNIKPSEKYDFVSEVLVTINEGKFHQIKRMFEAVNKQVIYLKRISMGSLMLDNNLSAGEYRKLTNEEISNLKTLERTDKKFAENSVSADKKFNMLKENNDMFDNIEAVIFDLDGTLIDSMWMWDEIDKQYLMEFGIERPDDLQESIEGMSFTQTAYYFKERFKIPYSIDEIKVKWNEMAYDKYANEVPFKEGAISLLNKLRENKIKIGIATSNSIELVNAVLSAHKAEKYFDEIHTSCEVNKGKPAPDIYLYTAKCLGINPNKCLVFEDVLAGIEAGKSAGMKVCAVYDKYSDYYINEKKQAADYYIESFTEIL